MTSNTQQSLAAEIRAFIASHQVSEPHEQAQEGYTGSGHIHHGLSAPTMRTFVREWTSSKQLSPEQISATLDDLYNGASLDEKVIAGMLLARFPKFRRTLPLETLDAWLGTLEGWAEVDSTCQSTFPPAELFSRWDTWEAFLRQLASDPNTNKRRASLVLLIRTVRERDDPRGHALALELIDRLKREKDKRITKAVSWLLREAIKRHRAGVEQYVAHNEASLPAVAVREVRKKLATGKK